MIWRIFMLVAVAVSYFFGRDLSEWIFCFVMGVAASYGMYISEGKDFFSRKMLVLEAFIFIFIFIFLVLSIIIFGDFNLLGFSISSLLGLVFGGLLVGFVVSRYGKIRRKS